MANIQETKIFLGGMDKDNSPESVNQYDYIDAHNVRNVGKEGGDENYIVNLEGTKLITQTLPLGINKSIGTKRFETVGKSYTVKYNSQGYHQIVEFDYESETETIIYQNLTDSGNVDILSITANSYFTDIRLMHEVFLILNNGVNPIYCINIETYKQRRGNYVFKLEDLLLIKAPSLVTPKTEYISDPSRTTNNLRGSLFQFRTQLGYQDFRDSVWGTVSKRTVPINESGDGYGQNVQLYNGLRVAVDIGSDRVETIRIATRSGNGNWLLVKEVKRDYVLALPNTNVDVPDIPEAYNPITNEYIFLFYNDGGYPVIDQVEVDLAYDSIPDMAESVEIVNGNILAIGGLTEGKDRPVIEDFTASVATYDPNISTGIEGGGDFDTNGYTQEVRVVGVLQRVIRYTLYLKGTPKAGDIILIETRASDSALTKNSYRYTVTNANELGGLPSVYQSLAGILPNSSFSNTYVRFETEVDTPDQIKTYSVTRSDIGTIVSKSISTLKTNSSYQMSLAYYDIYGRYFPIVTDDRFIIKTPAYPDSLGYLPEINWQIQEEAPEGAAGYQLLLSENQTHQSSIWLTGKYNAELSTTGYLAFNLKSLERFFENEKESQVTYSFTKGDKVTLMYATLGTNNTPIRWFRYPFIDLDIVDFIIEDSPEDPNDPIYTLKVRNTSFINTNTPAFTNGEILMELYTPKKRSTTTESLLFYEIGENYPIVDGKHTVTNGTIREGDWYYKGRLYESTINNNQAITYLVEDPNFSDNYESKYWSSGRGRLYEDEQGRVFKQASIRYSDEYIYGSRYNGMSRFYFERIYGELGGQTTSVYGSIKRLEMRDNSLMCIQEFKVGVIPVYKSIIFDNTDTSLVADSGKIFGSVQYRNGNYGCGDAKESVSVSRNGVIYFIDDNNCVPVRDSLKGLQIIDVNLHREFIKYVKRAKDNLQKIIGVFDDNFNEYNITLSDNSNDVVTIDFSSNNIEFNEDFTILPSSINIVGVNGGTVTLNNGVATFTPEANFVGEASFLWQFNHNGKLYQNREYIIYSQGDSVPDQFTFTAQTNQQLNVVVESNVITVNGINMPTTVSITGGEYSKNGGAWTSANGTAILGDTFKVRVTSSGSNNTTTSANLNIGTSIGVFNVTTIPENVTPNEYLNISGTVFLESSGELKIRLDLSHALTTAYSIQGYVTYTEFGSDQVTPNAILAVQASETSSVTPVGLFLVTESQIKSGNLVINTSSLANGSVVLCQDGVNRIVSIRPLMTIPLS